jgi:hypothetical protein
VAARAADDNVCIAKYENCTHVCNFLDKVKVKLTIYEGGLKKLSA